MKIAIVSSKTRKSPDEKGYVFPFYEALEHSKRDIETHVIRAVNEPDSIGYGIHFHGSKSDMTSPEDRSEMKSMSEVFRVGVRNIRFMIKHIKTLPSKGYFIPPWRLVLLFDYAHSITDLVESDNLDIIHAYFAYPEGFASMIAKDITKKPLVISVLGIDVQSDPKSGYGLLSRKSYRAMVVQALKNADAIIVGSDGHYNAVKELIGESNINKIHFILDAIDTKQFECSSSEWQKIREEHNIKPNQPVVLFPRHLIKIYGCDYLIKAAADVVKKHPETVFLILGGGPERGNLEKLSEKLGISKNTIFVGYVPKGKMPFYYHACDMVVDPCTFGMGYSSLEALSCCKPVIGFRISYLFIEDGMEGFLVPPFDAEKFAEKINWLIENPEERKKMGENGRKLIQEKHNYDARIKTFLELYNDLIKKANDGT